MQNGDRLCCAKCGKYGGLTFEKFPDETIKFQFQEGREYERDRIIELFKAIDKDNEDYAVSHKYIDPGQPYPVLYSIDEIIEFIEGKNDAGD